MFQKKHLLKEFLLKHYLTVFWNNFFETFAFLSERCTSLLKDSHVFWNIFEGYREGDGSRISPILLVPESTDRASFQSLFAPLLSITTRVSRLSFLHAVVVKTSHNDYPSYSGRIRLPWPLSCRLQRMSTEEKWRMMISLLFPQSLKSCQEAILMTPIIWSCVVLSCDFNWMSYLGHLSMAQEEWIMLLCVHWK
jgi:hypothetical protein